MTVPKRNIRKKISANVVDEIRSCALPTQDDFKLELDPTAKYEFPVIDEVPADHYLARLDHIVPSLTVRGQPAVDTCQTFMNREGDLFYVRQRYVKDSLHYKKLIQALCAAGAPLGKSIVGAVGVIERLRFGYPSDSEIGSIIKRLPYEYKDGETKESLAEYFEDYPDD